MAGRPPSQNGQQWDRHRRRQTRDTKRKWAIKAIRAQNIFTHIYVDNLNNKKKCSHNGPPYAVICINKKRPQNANDDRFVAVAVAAVIPKMFLLLIDILTGGNNSN